MTDDDVENEDVQIEDEPDFNTVLEAEEDSMDANPHSFGRGFVIAGFVVSALLGGALGMAGSKFLQSPDKTPEMKAGLEENINELKQALETGKQAQEKNLGTLTAARKKDQARLRELATKNQELHERITQLEQKPDKDTLPDKTLSDRIAVLEAMSGENADMFEGSNSITARLDALEQNAFAKQNERPESSPDAPSDIDPGSAQETATTSEKVNPAIITDAGSAITDEASVQDSVQPSALNILMDTFPRDKLLAAVKAQKTNENNKPGWLKRMLSKHVKVRKDEAVDPYTTIDAAEAAMKEGQIAVALEHIAKLNPPVRTSAAEWVQAARKAAAEKEQEN